MSSTWALGRAENVSAVSIARHYRSASAISTAYSVPDCCRVGFGRTKLKPSRTRRSGQQRQGMLKKAALPRNPHGTCTTWLTPTSWGAVVFDQLGGDHATIVKEFRTLAGLGVDLCKGCVGAVNSALERRAREWIGGIGPLVTRAPEARGITITIPKRAPMTPLNSRR